MLYHNPQAVVQVNGRRSRAFEIERSVRQGCPLSPLLYVLVLEPLLRRLRDGGVPFAGSYKKIKMRKSKENYELGKD